MLGTLVSKVLEVTVKTLATINVMESQCRALEEEGHNLLYVSMVQLRYFAGKRLEVRRVAQGRSSLTR